MRKVAILALHLGFGGTERAVISEANLLADFCEVEIFSLYQLEEKPAFHVDERVKVTYLSKGLRPNKEELRAAFHSKNPFRILKEGLRSAWILFLRRLLMIRAIRKSEADIMISSRYLYHRLLTRYAREGVICIAQEHNHHNNDQNYIAQQLRAIEYMDYFMPVSQELTDFWAPLMPLGVKCRYIPHHLEYIPETLSPLTEKNIACVGRLTKEKGLDDLLLVINDLIRKYPDWTLHIAGDGEEREHLENLIDQLSLKEHVVLHGYLGRPQLDEMLHHSSVYVMTSHTESFGLVLIEAQSHGLPCVAFDSAQGAQEIITSEENGILIPNRSREQMAAALERLMTDAEYRHAIGEAGRQNALSYSADAIRDRWQYFMQSFRLNH